MTKTIRRLEEPFLFEDHRNEKYEKKMLKIY